MQIEKMFEEGIQEGLFTDFHVCVRGPVEVNFSGGRYVTKGARLFDVASLTKALTHLEVWKLFEAGEISPNDYLDKFIPVRNNNGRQLRHFMSYLVQDYGFDYKRLRAGELGPFKDVLLQHPFGDWKKKCGYDNYSSAYLGIMLEEVLGKGLEEIFHSELCKGTERENLLFHPAQRGMDSGLAIPTSQDESLRGITHDLTASAHSAEDISLAGVFSDAETIASIFHRVLQSISSRFYIGAAQNQLAGIDDEAEARGLGFDIPAPKRGLGSLAKNSLIFGAWTGCRIFFTKDLTICIMTNRTFFGHSKESLEKFSAFSWNVIREILKQAQ